MKVLLLEDIHKLGSAGSIVEVKDGYARNYLIPKGFAIRVTPSKLKEIEARQRAILRKRQKARERALSLSKKLDGMTVRIEVMVGKENKLYGSVTAPMIAEELKKMGFEVDRHAIELDKPIKELGLKQVKVKLFEDIRATINVEVVPKGEEAQG